MHFRNNLILGQNMRPMVFAIDTFTNYSSSDYNGFLPNGNSEVAYQWNSPAFKTAADYKNPLVKRSFHTLEEYSKATGQDRHSRELDFSSASRFKPTAF